MRISAAEHAILKYRESNRNSPMLELKLPIEIENDDAARYKEIRKLCEFLREGSIRNDSDVGIRLMHNKISNGEANELFKAMKGLRVSNLRINSKNMDADTIGALAEVILASPEMSRLDLLGSSFTNDGSRRLGEILPLCENVSSLILSATNFNSSGAQGLYNLIDKSHKLYELRLNGSDFGNSIKDLWPAISRSPRLSILNLEYSGINSEGMSGMADAILSTDKKFDSLELSQNQVGDRGCDEIARIIADNRLLSSELNLYNIGIGDDGINIIADALTVGGKNISTLRLGQSNISSQGFGAALEKFKQNAFLTETDLIGFNAVYAQQFKEIYNRNAAIEDAVSDYSKSVLAPRLVRAVFRNEEGEINLSDEVVKTLNQITRQQLFKDLTSEEILEFSEYWHQPLQQTKSNGSKDFGKDVWSPIFGEDKKEIDVTLEGMEGWKLVTRNNAAELKKEGRDLQHCVGGYAGKCLRENSHIISVVNPQGNSVSTIEIQTNYSTHKFRQNQHMGSNNRSISQESKRIEDWLYKEIEEGRISINYDALYAARQTRVEEAKAKIGGQTKMVIGFDPLDDKKIKKVKKVFREMLPAGNQQLQANFSSLASLEEIIINGKKYDLRYDSRSALPKAIKADLTQEEKDKKLGDEMAEVIGKIQENLNVIFGEGVLQVSISDKKTKKNPFGQVVLEAKGHLEENLLNQIKEIFNGDVNDNSYAIDSRLSPKTVLNILKKRANLQSNEEKKPSANISLASEEKLDKEEKTPTRT